MTQRQNAAPRCAARQQPRLGTTLRRRPYRENSGARQPRCAVTLRRVHAVPNHTAAGREALRVPPRLRLPSGGAPQRGIGLKDPALNLEHLRQHSGHGWWGVAGSMDESAQKARSGQKQFARCSLERKGRPIKEQPRATMAPPKNHLDERRGRRLVSAARFVANRLVPWLALGCLIRAGVAAAALGGGA